ncbi:DUF1906 domain-containing protein [Streptomyces sp. NPDC058308]|uniref:DUF1906 domain-containing protein n=1 Tax=Streptomyces sp. NPDC058308 TaxID=3346440 RepID=UPI0036EBAF1F
MRLRKLIIGLALVLTALTADLSASPPGIAAEHTTATAGGAARPGAQAAAKMSTFRGRAFDTCITPSTDTMRRWKGSGYGAVGIYYAGRGRACKNQSQLNHGWMRAMKRMGWRVLPVYVGSQSPCVVAKNKKHVSIGRDPWGRGRSEARDAVRAAKAIGIRQQSPLYLDMEAYTYRTRSCADPTLSFVRSWDREVRRQGYVPGFYSSASAGVRHMELARRAGARDLPAVMWFARWHTEPALYREPMLSSQAWRPARRIHQYAGNVKERHGGRTLLIDRNYVHAPVARIG